MKLRELQIDGVIIERCNPTNESTDSYGRMTAPCHSKLLGAEIFYQSYWGKFERIDSRKGWAIMKKNTIILPRSIYPILSDGNIVVKINFLLFEIYYIIKDFKISDKLDVV